jgi:hypothetical protein
MFVFIPPGTEMFYFPGYALASSQASVMRVHLTGFPHSDIFGSKVARHLPEAYRRHAASFIAFSSQGIHHTPLDFPLGNLKTTIICLQQAVSTAYSKRPSSLYMQISQPYLFPGSLTDWLSLPGIKLSMYQSFMETKNRFSSGPFTTLQKSVS